MLIKRRDTFEVDTELEAKQLIEDAKKSNEFELKKYSSQKKEVKKTGEEYYVVILEKEYGLWVELIMYVYMDYKKVSPQVGIQCPLKLWI